MSRNNFDILLLKNVWYIIVYPVLVRYTYGIHIVTVIFGIGSSDCGVNLLITFVMTSLPYKPV